jgi:CAAX prenyl protease-like protein
MFGISASPSAKAYLGPFAVFMALLALGEIVSHFGDGLSAWWVADPMYWVFPLQTVICGALLAWWWRQYEFSSKRGFPRRLLNLFLGIAVGVVALLVWVAPQELFGADRRVGGFDLWYFGGGSAFKWNLLFRMVRLVIVVPLLEEIFWRGFLLRHLIRDPFDTVPFGAFTWPSFAWVTLFFGFAHWGDRMWPPGQDFWTAIITSVLYNFLAVFTRSLGACVVAHAVTNLLLGFYIFKTQQWGFW